MFFPVATKDGKKALINLDQIFAFIEHGSFTIALATGGTTFEIPVKLEQLQDDLADFIEESETDD